jgi:formylglycine-generating enzyme required for sulfatase activity
LPTEAEYEFAATAGGTRQFPWGDTSPVNRICFQGNGVMRTSTCAVEGYPDGASPLGIFDLAGNVAEWTADWFGPYESAAVTNPSGASTGTQRVVRGGGWNFIAPELARARLRGYREPGVASDNTGVRCASGTR